jgi:phosphohistidine phosphatase
MKRLLIMRHAKSSWDDESIPDHDRKLNDRGLRVAPLMGGFVKQQGLTPDIILTSSALRAIKTAELFNAGFGKKIPIGIEKSLYRADVEEFCDIVREGAEAESTVLVISHNPTAAIASVRLSDKLDWFDLTSRTKGDLDNVWRPREVLAGEQEESTSTT